MANIPKEFKDTNPKDAVGVKKVSMSTVPAVPLAELAVAMTEGMYSFESYLRRFEVRSSQLSRSRSEGERLL